MRHKMAKLSLGGFAVCEIKVGDSSGRRRLETISWQLYSCLSNRGGSEAQPSELPTHLCTKRSRSLADREGVHAHRNLELAF
jgi:hypothetical protein